MKLAGVPVFAGVVFGKALLYETCDAAGREIEADRLENPAEKIAAYEKAVSLAAAELAAAASAFRSEHDDKAKILEAHRMLLEDVAMDEEIRTELAYGKSVSRAINCVYDRYISILQGAENEFTQERVLDMRDVHSRLIRCLAGEKEQSLSRLKEPVIIVAKELFPSETATIDRDKVLSIVTETGGVTSHTAIMARSYGIPSVLGVPGITGAIRTGRPIIVDASAGEVYISPTREEKAYCCRRQEALMKEAHVIDAYRDSAAITADGVRIQVKLNISDAASVSDKDARISDGAGLMRSEFLYMENQGLPDEDLQLRYYRAALDKFAAKPVILRTMDIGGDKHIPGMDLPKEDNPFLGKRALRLCFEQDAIFRTQLRAALRASAFGDLWIMFPMVGSLDDWRCAREYTYSAMEELEAEGVPFNRNVKLGVMLEVPSIALLADKVAREVDFASIGTNDLCQYLMAADRMNPEVSAYYQEFSPAMFRILRFTARAFADAGKSLGVCGEMGGDPRAVLALIGLGIHSLSMSATCIAGVKRVINNVTAKEASEIAEAICDMDTAEEIETELETRVIALSKKNIPERRQNA